VWKDLDGGCSGSPSTEVSVKVTKVSIRDNGITRTDKTVLEMKTSHEKTQWKDALCHNYEHFVLYD
jgi:hypothetical protein